MERAVEQGLAAGILIREFLPGDAPAFQALNEEWITRHFALEEADRQVLEDPERFILADGGAIFLAVAADGAAVGCCALIQHVPGSFELAKMAVAPGYRGAGIGRRMLARAIQFARELRAARLYLETNRKLSPAIHLYESAGFRHRPFPHPSPFARADVYMEYPLEDEHPV